MTDRLTKTDSNEYISVLVTATMTAHHALPVTKRAAARGEARITGNGRDRRVCDGRFRKG